MSKMDNKLLTKRAYSLRLKITKSHLKDFEEIYNGLRKKYTYDENKAAVLCRGYLEQIQQWQATSPAAMAIPAARPIGTACTSSRSPKWTTRPTNPAGRRSIRTG